MDDLTLLFSDVADALGIESVAIVEKDHYIVELLSLLKPLAFDTHQLVFAGGTALAKSGVALNRMSEDVDIKLVPTADFQALSRSRRKSIRKEIVQTISSAITATGVFSFDDTHPKVTRDEYRYSDIPVRYPQRVAQAPCLRPFIRLELMEAELLEVPESRDIHSLVTSLTGKASVGSDWHHLALGVAGWMRYVQGVDEQGQAIDIVDPLTEMYQTLNQQYPSPEERIPELLSIETIFGRDLSKNASFIQTVVSVCKRLHSVGARAAVASMHG